MTESARSTSQVSTIARASFSRINTSISIAVAANISSFLHASMGTSNAILVTGVGFILMVILGHGIIDVFHDPLGMGTHITILRSIIGTVGTTSVMKQVAIQPLAQHARTACTQPRNISHAPAQVANMGSSFASMSGGTSPGVVLGTCLILAAGVIPVPVRKTPEGVAIYMGTQYAYADLVMAAVPWQGVRIAISAGFVVLGPLIARWHLTSESVGPFSTLVSTLSFVGVSFAVDAVMPMTMGSPYEDVIRGTCAVLLLHAAIGYVPHLGKVRTVSLKMEHMHAGMATVTKYVSLTRDL